MRVYWPWAWNRWAVLFVCFCVPFLAGNELSWAIIRFAVYRDSCVSGNIVSEQWQNDAIADDSEVK